MLQFNRARSSGRAAHGPVGATGMPAGALGIWYAKDYNSAKKAIPNAATGASLVDVVTRYGVEGIPINEDGAIQEWGGAITAVSATGPLGGTITATRVLAAGDFYNPFAPTLAAGTYTLAFDVKSNTGSSVQFQSGQGAGGAMVQKTATTSWQRMSVPLVSGSAMNVYLAMSFDRATGADLLFSYVSIFNGSSDLGRLSGANLLLGSYGVTVSNPATGIIDMSGIGGVVQFDTAATPVASGFTGGVMLKRKVNSGFSYQVAFSAIEGFSKLGAFIENGQNTIHANFGGASVDLTGVWDTYGLGWHLFTYRWDGTYFDIFLDSARVLHYAPTTPTAFSMRTLIMGALKGIDSFTSNHYANSWFYYDSALTTVQIQSAVYPALVARLVADGQTHTQSRINSAEGDSITNGGSSYYSLSAANLTGQGVNYSVPGSGLSDLVTRFTSAGVGSVPVAGSSHIISVLIGANDLGSYTGASDAIAAANYTAALFSYFDSLRGAGWKVLACTVLPKDSAATHNARRAIVNANLRAAIGVHCEGVADFDADAQMGIDASFATYPANWTDGTHPNATGHARLAPIYYAAANAIT